MIRRETRTRLLFWLALTLATGPAPEGRAAPSTLTLPEFIQRIQAAYEATTDWEAEFRQITEIDGFDSPIASRGRLYIKKPGKLRWDYEEPYHQQIMVNDQKIWIYTPEQKQVVVSPMAGFTDSQLPLRLLMGMGRLDQDFTVEWADPDPVAAGGRGPLRLTPKDPKTGLTHLQIEVDPKKFFITRLMLYQVNGNHSRFQFLNIRNNTGLKDPFFIFIPPRGVAVVETPPTAP